MKNLTIFQIRHIFNFLDRTRGNQWFEFGPMEVYMRNNKWLRSRLEIANVVIPDIVDRRKGVLKTFLAWIEEVAELYDFNTLYIENVQELWLRNFFLDKGYDIEKPGFDWCASKKLRTRNQE